MRLPRDATWPARRGVRDVVARQPGKGTQRMASVIKLGNFSGESPPHAGPLPGGEEGEPPPVFDEMEQYRVLM
jgi:hypothetical protein